MTVLLHLFAVLLLARLFGGLFHRLGQPGSVGEIVAGTVAAGAIAWLGPAWPPLMEFAESPALGIAAEAGIFCLILIAGIEMQPAAILQRSLSSVLVALGGVVVPLAGGIAVAWAFLPAGPDLPAQALLVGVALAITAIPASIRVLEDLGIARSALARTILAAAVVDDVLGLVLMAVMVAMIETGGAPAVGDILWLLGKVVLFFAVVVVIGRHLYPAVRRGIELLQAMSMELSVLVLGALAYGALAEAMGLHWILGPFMAGLFFEPAQVGRAVYDEVRLAVLAVSGGIAGPLFFFSIGMAIDFAALVSAPGLVAALILVAFAGKILGAGVPAFLTGLDARQSLATGVGMCSRGAVELVILSIAAEAGLVAVGKAADPTVAALFSALVLTAVVTTLATPMMLRAVLKGA